MLSDKLKKARILYSQKGGSHVYRMMVHYVKSFWNKSVDEVGTVASILLKKTNSGIYFDVGAHTGGTVKYFMDSNWQIYGFEPDNANRKVLEYVYGQKKNLTIYDFGLGEKDEDELVFYKSTKSSGISSVVNFDESHEASHKIKLKNLSTVINSLDGLGERGIDFIKIDCEGFDFNVIKGFNWEHHKHPGILLCEFEDKKTLHLGYTFKNVADYMMDKGYQVLISEWFPISEYGGQHQFNKVKRYPCELDTEDAWGNIIAIKDEQITSEIFEKLNR